MTIGDKLVSSFPKTLNREAEIFSALIANKNKTGTFERILNEVKEYISYVSEKKSIYDLDGDLLLKVFNFLTFYDVLDNESDESRINRISAIFVRDGDTVWGNRLDIYNVFKSYFNSANVYVIENTNSDVDSLLTDITFINKDTWILNGCNYTDEDYFVDGISVKVLTDGTVSQDAEVKGNRAYYLHFMLNGITHVQIIDNNNRYWNKKTKSWESSVVNNVAESTEWTPQDLFFITDDIVDSVTVTFKGVNDNSYIDYVRLYHKQKYSSISVLVQAEKSAGDDALGLAPGGPDTAITQRVKNYGYYDNIYLTGPSLGFDKSYYESILEFIKPAGVKGYFEILNKNQE